MVISEIFGFNLAGPVLPQTSDNNSPSISLLNFIPPRYGFLLILLVVLSDCTLFTELPPRRPDGGGDGGEECVVGARRENYSGPEGTRGVGICQPEVFEIINCDPWQERLVQEEILPQEEIPNNAIDEDCNGSYACQAPIIDPTAAIGMVINEGEGPSCPGGENPCAGDVITLSFPVSGVINANGGTEDIEFSFMISRMGVTEEVNAGHNENYYLAYTSFAATGPDPYEISIEARDLTAFVGCDTSVGEQRLEVFVDPFCVEGEQREQYAGPEGTMNVGICRPYIEECQDRGEGLQYYEIQSAVLPTEEVCDGVDNDCLGPTPGEQWSRTFGGGLGNSFLSVQPTDDGGFIAAGTIDNDGWLVKVDESGVEQWSRTFGGEWTDLLYSVQPTSDGEFVAAGATGSFGRSWQGWLIRVNGEGIEQWNRTFGGEFFDDRLFSLQSTGDGGFIVAGSTYSLVTGDWDGWLVRVNGEGREQWSRAFGGGLGDSFLSVQPTDDGGFIAAGVSGGLSVAGWLVRVNGEGIEQWSRTFGGELLDNRFYSIQSTSDEGFIATGSTYSFGSEEEYSNGWLVRVDEEGIEQWSRTFGGEWSDLFRSAQQTDDGGFITAGNTNHAWLVRTDSAGNEEWSRIFDEGDHFSSVRQMSDNTFALAGGVVGGGGWLMKICIE